MNASEQNYVIATSIERAEKAMITLMRYDIAITGVDIGRWSSPVIQVEYSSGCEQLTHHGFCQTPDSIRGVWLTRVLLQECLVQWEQPLNPALDATTPARPLEALR